MTTKIDGTNGIIFPDSTTQSTAGVPAASLQICKAWASFSSQTSTMNVLASYNISSITYNSTGNFTVSFSTALSTANYVVLTGENSNTTANNNLLNVKSSTLYPNNTADLKSTTQLQLQCAAANSSVATNSAGLYFACFC